MIKFVVKNAADVDGQKEQIIKLSDVNSAIEEDIQTFKNAYIKNVNKLLDDEMSKGGLDPYAFCIEGATPAYDKAKTVKAQAEDLTTSITNVETKIKQECNIQRARELKELSKAIQTAIEEHEAKKADFESKAADLTAAWDQVREYRANCASRGISCTERRGFGNYCTYNETPKDKTATIMTPMPEDRYDDDISKEADEISKLKVKKDEVDSEATTANGEAG